MRIVFIGDVVGRSGRVAFLSALPTFRDELKADAVIVNGENAAGGFGITMAIAEEFLEAGTDLITTGNHVWDQRDLIQTIDNEPRILRPLNMVGVPGRGIGEFKTARGKRVVVLQVIGRLFTGMYDDPFQALEKELQRWSLGGNADAIIVDVHAETTSEKASLGHYLDGRVTAVVGTHTHVPTSDARILVGGTGFMTDIGMTGDYDSVIGMVKEHAMQRWLSDVPGSRLTPAMGEATLCAVMIEVDPATGLARAIRPIRKGPALEEAWPLS